ncbi:MAG: hypothetical protein ACM3JH_00470, partial [Acidithiobacillales bacterium]
NVVRRYSSSDKPGPPDEHLSIPTYWLRPPRILQDGPGLHRFVWDFRYPDPPALEPEVPISAIVHDTPRGPSGVLALPGKYTIRLTVDGKTYAQPLEVSMDPRVPTSQEGLEAQFDLAMRTYHALLRNDDALRSVKAFRERLAQRIAKAARPSEKKNFLALEEKAAALEGVPGPLWSRPRDVPKEKDFSRLNAELLTLLDIVESTDAAPTTQAFAAAAELEKALDTALARWKEIAGS